MSTTSYSPRINKIIRDSIIERPVKFKKMVDLTKFFTDYSFHPAGMMTFITRCKGLSGNQHRLLNEVYQYTEEYGHCRVSKETLARAVGVTRRSVIRIINELVEIGLISSERTTRADGSEGTAILRPLPITGAIVIKLQPLNLLDMNWVKLMSDFADNEWVQENCRKKIKDEFEQARLAAENGLQFYGKYLKVKGREVQCIEDGSSVNTSRVAVVTPISKLNTYGINQAPESGEAKETLQKPKEEVMRKTNKKATLADAIGGERYQNNSKKDAKRQEKLAKTRTNTLKKDQDLYLERMASEVTVREPVQMLWEVHKLCARYDIECWSRPATGYDTKDTVLGDTAQLEKFYNACCSEFKFYSRDDFLTFLENWFQDWNMFVTVGWKAAEVGFNPNFYGKLLIRTFAQHLRKYVPAGIEAPDTDTFNEHAHAGVIRANMAKVFGEAAASVDVSEFIQLALALGFLEDRLHRESVARAIKSRLSRRSPENQEITADMSQTFKDVLISCGCKWLAKTK